MKKLLSLFAVTASLNALSQQADSLFIRKLADEILVNGNAYNNLRELTKGIGGRLAGSPQMVRAEQWGLQALKKAGAENAWLQECQVPHWVRGAGDAATANITAGGKAVKRKLDALALGNSAGSMKPVTAPVILIRDFDELERRKDEVKGKIVFYNYRFNQAYVQTFLAYRDAGRYRGTGASRAAKYGAVGVITRSLSHSTDNFPHTGSMTYNDSFPKIPAMALGLQDADWLDSQLQSGKGTITMLTHGRFLPDTTGHNVIGEIKGSEFPDQYVTIGGHLDSWDVCEGAHDDGSGVVQTIEVLRALKALGYKPKRTIRFVLFANEENGLRGGNRYADEAKTKGEKHIFALESDEGGFTPRGVSFTVSDQQFQKIQPWKELLAPYGAGEFGRGGGGADIGPLARTQSTPTAGLVPDSQRYFDYHHARSDVFEAVNRRELLLGALTMAATIYLVDKYGL